MTSTICPYLGLIDDAKTNATFPFEGNACHQAKPPVLISLTYQQTSCLSPAHTNCPGYNDGWKKGFPKSLRGSEPRWKRSLPKFLILLLIFGLIAGFVYASLVRFFPWDNLNFVNDVVQGWSNTPTPTMTLPPTRTATPEPTELPTDELDTVTPAPTYTATKTKITIITRTATETETPTATETATRTYAPYIPPTDTARPAPPVSASTATATTKPTKAPTNPPPPTATFTKTPDYRP